MSAEIIGNKGPLVVALHGIQGTCAAWRPIAMMLDGRARFVLPNLRGRGDALRGRTVQDYGLPAFADDVRQVIARQVPAGVPYYVAGWSMGVSVALEWLAAAGGPLPRGLILASGTPCLAQVRWFDGEGDALLANVAERQRRLGLVQAADPDAVALTWQAIRDGDQRPLLPGVRLPTLVVHGRDDDDCSWPLAQELAAGIAGARLLLLDGVGRGVLAQATRPVADAMNDFITELET